LNDAFNLADAQQLSYDVALDLTKYLVNENQYVPWSVATSAFKKIGGLIYNSTSFSSMTVGV
jgi:glutamyl aminopeptidase